jgi:murein DD-endopeptidase MepM/ murein hydrolase activator NlpD
LTRLEISHRALFAFGQPVRVAFVIRDRSRRVRARIDFVRESDGRAIYRANLGRLRTGVRHYFDWRGTEGGNVLRPGAYRVRLVARDGAGNRLLRSQASTRNDRIYFQTHRFHLPAATGTPVVAPHAGTIIASGSDPAGAGNYLVLDSRGEDLNYVFMHLQDGSVRVAKGAGVATGERIASVGSTGHSTGPHLHFEIWKGPWFAGGKAIDPLPALRSWDRDS